MSLRLRQLSCEPQAFEAIKFRKGVNLVLGEKSGTSSGSQKDKVNGVGKSVFVDFLHFALCRAYPDTRVSRIPDGVLPTDLTVILDLEIHGLPYQIRRRPRVPDQVMIIDSATSRSRVFPRLEDATEYLGSLLFKSNPLASQTSFRQLLSLLMRDEASGFRDPLNPMSTDKRALPPLQPHLYLLGVSYEIIQYYEVLKRELKALTESIGNLEKLLTDNRSIKIADVPAKLNEERDRVKFIEDALAELKTDPAFRAVEDDLIAIEKELLSLRSERKRLAWEIEQIRVVPHNERVDSTDIKIIYDRIRAGLGDLVKKSLDQAMAFKAEVEQFQQSLIREELGILDAKHHEVQQQIARLTETHRDLTSRIDSREVLDELRNGLSVAAKQTEDYQLLSSQFQMRERQIKEKLDLKLRLEKQLREVTHLIESHHSIQESVEARIIGLHKRIMGSASASFKLVAAQNTQNNRPFGIDIRIKDDRSKSVDEAKVFIYDFSLLTSPEIADRHPRFLLHDNILEVDNDTMVQSLNFLNELEESGLDFQYILTINRDKIEPAEISRQIMLDIEPHTIARFTKQSPFLKKNYQEI